MIKNDKFLAVIFFFIFVILCTIMAKFGSSIENPILTYLLIAPLGISAVAWPIYAMRSFSNFIRNLMSKR